MILWKKDKTVLGIIDAKSTKNTDIAEEKGYDAGKNVSGIKLHIIVDTMGLPHTIYVSCANVTDRNGVIQAISLNSDSLSCIKKYIVDGGYTEDKFASAVKEFCEAEVEVVKKNEVHKFEVLHVRRIAEHSFDWPEKCRRLWRIWRIYVFLYKKFPKLQYQIGHFTTIIIDLLGN